MTARRLLCLTVLAILSLVVAVPAASAAPQQAKADGGLVRAGTVNQFDSMNPFVAFSSLSYIVFTNIYPTLVEYDAKFKITGDWAKDWTKSKDGLTWTFHLKPGGKWSDGKPLTADDGAWTGNLILKYAKTTTSTLAPFLSHAKKLTAPDATTLVITYGKAVANVLPQLQQFFILPRHVWEPVVGANGKGLKNYDPGAHLPIVGGGSFSVTKYDKKGTTILQRNPGFYGTKPHLDAVGITWFANADAMLAALKGGDLDYIDEVPFTVADQLGKSGAIQLVTGQGSEVRDFGFNSSPKKKKNRELLDPKLRAALSHAFDRKQIVDVVFRGHAAPRGTLLTPISTPYMNTKLPPEKYDLALAGSMLDKLGYKRGSNGIRVTPGAGSHPMAYDVITPDSISGIDREFAIVRDSFAKIGVKLTQRSYDSTTAFAEITKPKNQYLDYDMMMWDWVGYTDPDFVLSVVGCDQYGGWSDTAYCNKEYDQLYKQQGTTLDPAKRKAIVWKMQEILYRDKPYVQLVQVELIYGFRKGWTGIAPPYLTGFGKSPWITLVKS
jgi:peptide/nickel transport system substrate-binding protein